METFIYIIGILIALFLGGIFLFGFIIMWMISQGFKSKDDFDELRKNREKLQW